MTNASHETDKRRKTRNQLRSVFLTLWLCLLFFLFVECLFRSGTIKGDGGRSESSWRWSSGWAAGSSLLAASSSSSSSCRWQTADRESKSLLGSSEFLCLSSAAASLTSFWAAWRDVLDVDLAPAVLLDKWDILGFLLARGSVYSSGRECFGRCAGDELGVSRSGLTWASGTLRRLGCGWNSLLHKKQCTLTHS